MQRENDEFLKIVNLKRDLEIDIPDRRCCRGAIFLWPKVSFASSWVR